MPPYKDFYIRPSEEALAAAQEWRKADLYPREGQVNGFKFACIITLSNGTDLLGNLDLEAGRWGMGEISLPVVIGAQRMIGMTQKERDLLIVNAGLLKEMDKIEVLKRLGVDAGTGEFNYSPTFLYLECGRKGNILGFRRHKSIYNQDYHDNYSPDEALIKQRLLSAEGLAQVAKRDLGWTVAPLKIRL